MRIYLGRNEMNSDRSALLDKIHANGYWRVNIRPTRFEENRIPSLSECRRIVEASRVVLRGWDYPHVRPERIVNGNDWIESSVDWQHGHIEYWRLFQSGQFVHHSAMREDYEETSRAKHGLDFLNTLYTITEIFEFSARIAAQTVLTPEAIIEFELHGTADRRIFSWDPGRYFSMDYVCRIEAISHSDQWPDEVLLGRAAELALDATVYVLERFNWTEVPRGLLAEEQRKFLGRRM